MEKSTRAPSYYSNMLKNPASKEQQPRGWATERRQSSTSSGPAQPQNAHRRVCSKSQQQRGPGPSLTNGDTPVEVVPKDPVEYPSSSWIRDVSQQVNWFLYNEVSDLSNERQAQVVLQVIDHMTCHKLKWLFNWEQEPLWYMGYLVDIVKKYSGINLKQMRQ